MSGKLARPTHRRRIGRGRGSNSSPPSAPSISLSLTLSHSPSLALSCSLSLALSLPFSASSLLPVPLSLCLFLSLSRSFVHAFIRSWCSLCLSLFGSFSRCGRGCLCVCLLACLLACLSGCVWLCCGLGCVFVGCGGLEGAQGPGVLFFFCFLRPACPSLGTIVPYSVRVGAVFSFLLLDGKSRGSFPRACVCV